MAQDIHRSSDERTGQKKISFWAPLSLVDDIEALARAEGGVPAAQIMRALLRFAVNTYRDTKLHELKKQFHEEGLIVPRDEAPDKYGGEQLGLKKPGKTKRG